MNTSKGWLVGIPLCVAVILGAIAAPAEASPYDPRRIDAELARDASASPNATFNVIVEATTERGASERPASERARDAVGKHGGRARFALGIVGGVAATVTGRELIPLSRNPGVRYISRDAAVTASWDPLTDYAKVTSLPVLATYAHYAWQYFNVCGRGVTVAVVDSGVHEHQDLAGRVVASVDLTQDVPVFADGALGDPGGHGTHVAGLVAGDGTASGGALTGTAPCARIVSVRVLDAYGRSTTSTVLRGLQWVLANRATYGIRVVNLSFGTDAASGYRLDPLSAAVEALTLAGMSVVAAAGNAGPTYQTISSPARDPFVFAVGAYDDAGTAKPSDDTVATFSARGPSKFDLLAKPDLIAPGRRVVSLLAPGSTLAVAYPERLVTAPGASSPQYLRLSGTSMSAPLVSGLIALLLESEPTLTPFQVKYRMKNGVKRLNKIALNDAGKGLATAGPLWYPGDLNAEYPAVSVSDALASQLFAMLYGQPIPLRSLTYNGGTDSDGTSWSGITWENIAWDNVSWDNIAWDQFRWDNIAWENITWDMSSFSADQQGAIIPGTATWKLVD